MKHILWTLLALSTSVLMVACGKSGGGGGNNNGAPPIIVTPTGVVNNTNAYFADNWSNQSSITITNQTAYREFLRTSMGVCDRTVNTGGVYNCTSWISGGLDIVLNNVDLTNNTAAVTFRAWPQQNTSYYYGYQLPANGLAGWVGAFFGMQGGQTAGVYYNPLAMNSFVVSPINASQGFELRSYGPSYSFGNRSLIQVQVDAGHLGDGSFTFKLGYPNCVQDSSHTCSNPQGVWFATGTFRMCQTSTCAVPGGMW